MNSKGWFEFTAPIVVVSTTVPADYTGFDAGMMWYSTSTLASPSVPGSRVTYTMTPRMFASALLQHNSSSNVRPRWEYRPGSEFFLVYNDGRDTLAPGFPRLVNRAFIVKINRLFRL